MEGGQRVELNAFTAPRFIEWLESKLEEHLTDRLVPDQKILEDAYRRALVVAQINHAIKESREEAIKVAKDAEIPADLQEELTLDCHDEESWDVVLYNFVKSKLYPDDED